jgi:hypothetical protein
MGFVCIFLCALCDDLTISARSPSKRFLPLSLSIYLSKKRAAPNLVSDCLFLSHPYSCRRCFAFLPRTQSTEGEKVAGIAAGAHFSHSHTHTFIALVAIAGLGVCSLT